MLQIPASLQRNICPNKAKAGGEITTEITVLQIVFAKKTTIIILVKISVVLIQQN